MTRRISLIVGVAVVALTVVVPTAFGQGGRFGSSVEPDGVAYFRANEMSTLAQQSVVPVSTYRDANERPGAVVNQSKPGWLQALEIRGQGLDRMYGLGEFADSGYLDAHERSAPPVTSTTPTRPVASSGRDFEWPEIGIGLGLAFVLLLGVGLAALRTRRHPPLAH